MTAVRRATLVLSLVLLAPSARAFPPFLFPTGRADFVYGPTVEVSGGAATGQKPESKLFYTDDGRWWAVLGVNASVALYELDANHVWQARVPLPEADAWEKADALLVERSLYVAMRDNRKITGNGRHSRLFRLTYLGDGQWMSLGPPTPITDAALETLTLARDGLGRLWVAFEVYGHIQVGHTAPGGTAFTFSSLPTPIVASDDIAAVTSFAGRIGVMWSDQKSFRDWFAWRYDSDPLDAPWHVETAYGAGVGGCTGGHCADDHINLKVVGNEVYAAIKTNLDALGNPGATQIALLRRAADGTWSAFPVSPVSQRPTRPIVLLAPELDRIWVFAKRGSGVSVWESRYLSPGFDATASHRWTTSSAGTINDPTSTKQVVTAASGAVVETSLGANDEYWHNEWAR